MAPAPEVACRDGFARQLEHFPGSVAPNLPGHLDGNHKWLAPMSRVIRNGCGVGCGSGGWGTKLVLSGFTLGACIALQYALDYPVEVAGLALMTVSMRRKERAPGSLEMRLEAARNPEAHRAWLDAMAHAMMWIEPGLRERLLERHRQVGPISQRDDLVVIDNFDVAHRIHELKAPLTLIRGVDDPGRPPEYELEIHRAVPGSRYLKLERAGHFPMAERPDDVNRAIEELLAAISAGG